MALNGITSLPQHVAVIMDGNRRWAERHEKPRVEGHRAGVENLRLIVERVEEYGIKYLTVYAFSTENWNRSTSEIDSILHLLEEIVIKKGPEIHEQDIKLRHLGRLDNLPVTSRRAITDIVTLTENNNGLNLNFAFNYGGRTEIVDAARKYFADTQKTDQLDEKHFSKYLYTAGIPDVDLLIRTGGETRLSNFLLWQCAYSEIYFTDILWPDFSAAEFDKAVLFYRRKERRFGGG